VFAVLVLINVFVKFVKTRRTELFLLFFCEIIFIKMYDSMSPKHQHNIDGRLSKEVDVLLVD
jgi:hypothetical protein